MRYWWIVAGLVGLVSGQAMAWEVSQHVDPLTDKSYTVAEVKSNNAVLRVICVNKQPYANIIFPVRIGYGSIGTVWRLDDGPLVTRFAWISDTGQQMNPWNASESPRVFKASRVRVQISTIGMLDFDTREAPRIKC